MNYDLYVAVLRRIYREHNPKKESGLPDLLRKYKGREKELIKSICEKYNISDDVLRQYANDYRTEQNDLAQLSDKNNAVRVFAAVLVMVVVILIVIAFMRNGKTDEVSSPGIEKENSIGQENESSQEKSSSNNLNFADLKQIAQMANQSEVLPFLRKKSSFWSLRGEDGEGEIIYACSEPEGTLAYHRNEKIWEYVFFDGYAYDGMMQSIEMEKLTLFNQSEQEHGYSKTYGNNSFVVQAVLIQLTSPDKPYGYKILISENKR